MNDTDGQVVIGIDMNTKSFEYQIDKVERELYELDAQYAELEQQDGFDEQSNEAVKLRAKIEECTNKLVKLRQEQSKLDNNGYDNIKNRLKDMGKEMDRNAKKVAKWALAIFGVREAYSFVRNAISTIAQDDPQLKADIDYIRSALAYTIEPLVRGIVDFVKQLLTYIGYIIKVWTGKNIFENANKSLKSANKQAEKMQKTLAGFDEMNVLSDSTSSGGGDASSSPSFDLSNIDNIEVPGWIKWIAQNKEIVIGALIGIGAAIGLIKLEKLIGGLSRLKSILTPLGKWIAKNSKTIAGVVLIADGIVLVVRGIINYFKDPSWNNFLTILLGVAAAAGGVLLIFGGIPALITAIIGLVVAIGAVIVKNWDAITKVVGNIAGWINEHLIKPVINFFTGLFDWLLNSASNLWSNIKGIFIGVADWVKEKVIDPVAGFFTDLWDGVKETFVATWDFIISSFSKVEKYLKE